MGPTASSITEVTAILGWVAVVLGAVGFAGTTVRVVRKRGPYLTEFCIAAMSTGAFIGGWSYSHQLPPNDTEILRNVGMAIFVIAALSSAALTRRRQAKL